jgi:hypothetical protein
MMASAASPDGTRRFVIATPAASRAATSGPAFGDLTVASLGLGTYLGEPDDATDAAYAEALARRSRSAPTSSTPPPTTARSGASA